MHSWYLKLSEEVSESLWERRKCNGASNFADYRLHKKGHYMQLVAIDMYLYDFYWPVLRISVSSFSVSETEERDMYFMKYLRKRWLLDIVILCGFFVLETFATLILLVWLLRKDNICIGPPSHKRKGQLLHLPFGSLESRNLIVRWFHCLNPNLACYKTRLGIYIYRDRCYVWYSW